MLLCDSPRCAALEGAGLMAGYYYDPYPPRFSANLREILASGARVMVRLHAGVRYPMSEDERIHTVDREGHVVAVVGYPDPDHLLFGDPWDVEAFGGRDGRLRVVDHRDLALRMVNSTADKAIFLFPLSVELSTASIGAEASTITATVGLTAPAPQIRIAADLLADVSASINIPAGLELLGERRQARRTLGAGERLAFSWDIRENGPVHGVVSVAVAGTASSTDPYPFRDTVGSHATATLRSVDLPVPATAVTQPA